MALVVTTGFDIYHQQLVRGVLPVLEPHGLTLVVNSVNVTEKGLPASVAQLIRTVTPYGVIATTCATPEEEDDLFSLLEELGIPTVLIAARTPGRSYVHGDDRSGMRELMGHLLDECGVRRPALARGVTHQPDAVIREQVFREELAARGIPVDDGLVFEGRFWHEDAYRELRALLHRCRDMDAVVASNDISALGVLKALTDEGLRVPEDILVTGFDNYPSALSWPALTTVDPEHSAQGAAAAERLLAEVDGAPAGVEIVVPTRFLVRGSTRSLTPDDPEQIAAVVDLARVAQEQLSARDALWGLSYAMSHCMTLEEVAEALSGSSLSRLGIDRCFLAVFTDDPLTVPAHPDDPVLDVGPEASVLRARLIFNYRKGDQGPVPSEVFPLGQLLPEALLSELESKVLVFHPLTSSNRELGYILFEQSRGPALASEWLRTDLSRTLETLFSAQALKAHAETLENEVAHRTAELAARSAELAARSEQLEAEVETRRKAEERLQQVVNELHQMAMSDGLTQLANRVALQEHLTNQWRALAHDGGEMALLMVDVDLFKAYNDHYGHMMGDEALRVVASHLTDAARYPDDLACRYGGEEFVLALPDSDLEGALRVAERFRAALAQCAIPHATSSVAPVVTVSIGIAVARARDDNAPWALLEHADRALYRAKTQGRNRVCAVQVGPGTGDPPLPQPRRHQPDNAPAPG
jgi:diguanylate cyclase (GGDEF)-like protein